jgi:two-component system, OmpR family, response regulator RstA
MTSTANILLVDDDIELSQLISQYLSTNGYHLTCLADGENIDKTIKDIQPEIIILDLMLPGIDGLSICKNIRRDFNGAIIMLTALGDDIDEVTGLEVGADDYLAKPIQPRVLLAHIRAQLRRQTKIQQNTKQSSICCFDKSITIDASKRTVVNKTNDILLSSAEFDLLWLLAQNVGTITEREYLHQQIFRLPYDGVDRSIDLRISRIRKKLNDDPKDPQIIKTVRNVGYLLAR